MVHKGGAMEFRSDGGNLLRKRVACISAMIVASAILQSGTASAREREERGNGGLLRAGNGPGPAANGPGPGCNINSRMVAPFAHYDQTSIHGSKFTASTNTRSHRIDFVTDASSHDIPGIENLNAKPGEVPDVAGDDRKIMFNGGCGDHAVRCVERRSF